MKTTKIQCKTVLIANRIANRENLNIFQRNLEYSSDTMFTSLMSALKEVSEGVTYYSSLSEFIDNIGVHKDDIIISTVWSGVDNRNRRVFLPAICESYGLLYVGADAYVQAVSSDKILSKSYCKQYGIPSARGITLTRNKEYHLLNALSYPVVVKPNFEGGSIGISDDNVVDNISDAIRLAELLLKEYNTLIVEEYLEGQEVSACIVGSNGKINMFEIVKISLDNVDYFTHRILGYQSKKGKMAHQEREIITNEVPTSVQEQLKNAFLGLGKTDFMRIDGRLKDGVFSLIELTPDCSLHPDCFMYKAFSHNGYSYPEMIAALLNQALDNNIKPNKY